MPYLDDGVEGGVSPDAEVSAGDVVADGGGQHAERHTELTVAPSSIHQLQHCLKRLQGPAQSLLGCVCGRCVSCVCVYCMFTLL